MVVFDHERLEVYKVATQYADAADDIAANLKDGNAHVRDQLRRASDSIVNNVAEGAGEFLPGEKARFYRIALRSGTESAATLHTCLRRKPPTTTPSKMPVPCSNESSRCSLVSSRP